MKRKKGKKKNKQSAVSAKRVTGTLSMSASGYGFLMVKGFDRDIFVPKKFIGKAMDRDKVEAELLPDTRSDGFIAKIIKVVGRGRQKIAGVLLAGSKFKPFSKKFEDDFHVVGGHKNARKGDWVELDIADANGRSGRICKVIGRAGDIQADLSAIISEYNLMPPYSEEEEEKAAKLEPDELEREEFKSAAIFTVDPEDAKDYDDAVSVRLLDDGNYELGVHIADVACWVRRGSWLDKAAYQRAFTSYLPGRTLPMLPKVLTERISLKPGRFSLAHTILMKICGKTGSLLSARRFHTRIKVAARLSFSDLEFFIANGRLPDNFAEVPNQEKLQDSLFRAVELYRLMRKRRAAEEEFLHLETESVRAIVDENGLEVKFLKREKQGEAEKLVEEFMLAANVEAAREITTRSVAGIYRVHPEPFEEKSREFCEFIRTVCGFSPGNISSRRVCNEFLNKIANDHRKSVLVEALLRAMARALYSEKRSIHFGLGKNFYSHFTSPIRRYPDLALHQQFIAIDRNEKLRSKAEFAEIAEHCTEKELLNDESFWAANDRLKLHYLRNLQEKEGEFFEALIAKIAANGFFIYIPELGIRGEIGREFIPGEDFSRGRAKATLHRGSKTYKAGQVIAVRLAGIDFIKGRALFQPL